MNIPDDYFKSKDEFQKRVDKQGIKILDINIAREMCKKCPSQDDMRFMNCAECCPIQRTQDMLKMKPIEVSMKRNVTAKGTITAFICVVNKIGRYIKSKVDKK